MDPEFLQVAREAVAALQRPHWVEIAQVLVNSVGVSCILLRLWSMGVDGKRRDREIDAMAVAFRKQGEAFDRLGEAMTQALDIDVSWVPHYDFACSGLSIYQIRQGYAPTIFSPGRGLQFRDRGTQGGIFHSPT